MRHHHCTTTALALLFGLGVAATGTPAGAQQGMAWEICDRNEDGFIDSQESWVCGDARFEELSEGGEYITDEFHLINLYTEAEDPEGLVTEMDMDRDERISREEWLGWNEERFAAATEATGGRMAVADYERFARGEEIAAAATAAGQAGLEDVVAQLRESGEFSTFVRAIEAAGLVEELKDAGPFTVFAPTDEAFNQLPQGALQQLMQGQDTGRLEDLVKHHVVLGEAYPADELPEQLEPMEGGTLNVGIADSGAVLRPQGGQQVAVLRDIRADNGYIQVIDAVLVPQQLAQALQTGQQQGQQQQGGQQQAQQPGGQQGQGQQQQAQQQQQQQTGGQQSGQQQTAQQQQGGQQQGGQQQAQQAGGQQGQQQATAAGGQQQQAQEQAVLTGGEISRERWTSVGAETFAAADADQSGFVTQEEFNQWAETNWGGTPGGGDDDGPLFGLLDVNDDVQLTEDEWFTEESFGALDDDDSGVLEDDEFGV